MLVVVEIVVVQGVVVLRFVVVLLSFSQSGNAFLHFLLRTSVSLLLSDYVGVCFASATLTPLLTILIISAWLRPSSIVISPVFHRAICVSQKCVLKFAHVLSGAGCSFHWCKLILNGLHCCKTI